LEKRDSLRQCVVLCLSGCSCKQRLTCTKTPFVVPKALVLIAVAAVVGNGVTKCRYAPKDRKNYIPVDHRPPLGRGHPPGYCRMRSPAISSAAFFTWKQKPAGSVSAHSHRYSAASASACARASSTA